MNRDAGCDCDCDCKWTSLESEEFGLCCGSVLPCPRWLIHELWAQQICNGRYLECLQQMQTRLPPGPSWRRWRRSRRSRRRSQRPCGPCSETGSRRYLTHDYNVCKFWCVFTLQTARLLPPAILFSPCGQFVRETVRTPRLDSAQNAPKLALATAAAATERVREIGRERDAEVGAADVWGHHLGPRLPGLPHAW